MVEHQQSNTNKNTAKSVEARRFLRSTAKKARRLCAFMSGEKPDEVLILCGAWCWIRVSGDREQFMDVP